MSGSSAEGYRCGACRGVVPAERVRPSAAHPLGEADCPHCGTRVAKLDPASWRGWLRMMFVVLAILGVNGVIREWPDGTWWPYALVIATSVGMLVHLRFQFRTAQRVLLPVMRY